MKCTHKLTFIVTHHLKVVNRSHTAAHSIYMQVPSVPRGPRALIRIGAMAAARLRVFLSLSTRTVTSNSWKLTRGVSSVVGSRDIPRGTLRGRPDASRGQGPLERLLHRCVYC